MYCEHGVQNKENVINTDQPAATTAVLAPTKPKKQLRERQEKLVNKAINILRNPTDLNRRSIAIAPTGSGKTVMFCTLVKRALALGLVKKVLILVHRTEIFYQNVKTFNECEGEFSHSLVCQEEKSLDGQVVFAMVLTFNNIFKSVPDIMQDFDLVIVDEAHHTCAGTYKRMLETIPKDAFLLGFTATPKRGDGQKLTGQYKHLCDQIFMHELIANKLLVPPKILQAIYNDDFRDRLFLTKTKTGDYDQDAAAEILNDAMVHEEMYKIWCKNAKNRQTVVFCTVVKHAKSVCQYLISQGEKAAYIYGDMDDKERKIILQNYQTGVIQILVNVAILIEGWDDPHTSCVVILRPSSYVSVVMQMIGRGLRSLPPIPLEGSNLATEGTQKVDCIVIDMGISCTRIRSLEQFLDFDMSKKEKQRLEDEKRRLAEAELLEEEERKKRDRVKRSFIERIRDAIKYIMDHENFMDRSGTNNGVKCSPNGHYASHWFELIADVFSIFVCTDFKFCAICIFYSLDNADNIDIIEEHKDCAFGIFKEKVTNNNTQYELIGSIGAVRMALEGLVLRKGGSRHKDWYDDTISNKQGFLVSQIGHYTFAGIAKPIARVANPSHVMTKGEASAKLDLHFVFKSLGGVFLSDVCDFETYFQLLCTEYLNFQKNPTLYTSNDYRVVNDRLLANTDGH